MKRYFLVDFENVFDSGLEGFFDLRPEDAVLIFYTQRANKINIDFFEGVLEKKNAASLTFIRVAYGNQALDLQLASFLGGLITEDPQDCAYYIVSKDKGFHCLPNFWLGRYDSVKLYQVPSIADALSPNRQENQPAALPAPAAQTEPTPEPALEATPPQPAAPAEEPQTAPPAEAPAVAEETGDPLPTPEPAPAPEAKAPRQENRQPQDKQGKAKPTGAPALDRNAINTKVQQILSKAKLEAQVINSVASLTSKNVGAEKSKQFIYREIIKQHGQKKGLEIYNLIKPVLK